MSASEDMPKDTRQAPAPPQTPQSWLNEQFDELERNKLELERDKLERANEQAQARAQARRIVSDADFPSQEAFKAFVKPHLGRVGMDQVCAFNISEDLIYQSVRTLFFASGEGDWPMGEEFQDKARQVGVALNNAGNFVTMKTGWYCFMWLVQKLEHDQRDLTGESSDWLRWWRVFDPPVSYAFSGVGEWRN